MVIYKLTSDQRQPWYEPCGSRHDGLIIHGVVVVLCLSTRGRQKTVIGHDLHWLWARLNQWKLQLYLFNEYCFISSKFWVYISED